MTPEQDAIYMSIPSGKRSSFFGIALELVKNGKIPELPRETNKKIFKEADEPKTIDEIKHHLLDVKTDSKS